MTARICTLYRYPLKGARGHQMESLQLDPVVGVVGDRVYAIPRKAPYGKWMKKAAFHVGMNSPAIATQTPRYAPHTAGAAGICRLDPDFVASLGRTLGIEGMVHVQDTYGGYTLADTPGAFVSFINLATVKALSEFIGRPVDPRRFRANAYIVGLDAFEELAWFRYPDKRKIQVGTHEMLIDDDTRRCQAIEANVDTGKHDETLRKALESLMSSRGYVSPRDEKSTCVIGIYGRVLDDGVIGTGDEIRLI